MKKFTISESAWNWLSRFLVSFFLVFVRSKLAHSTSVTRGHNMAPADYPRFPFVSLQFVLITKFRSK